MGDAKQKLRDAQAKIDQQRSSVESMKTTTEQRLEYIENQIGDNAGHKFMEFTKDLEKRLFYMQEDQKRARDVLESSLQEQLRLEHGLHEDATRQMKEHWERELKARYAYQETYKELITQERGGREAMENNMEQRMQSLERALSMETNRLWVAVDKHTHEGLNQIKEVIVQAPPPPPQIVEVLPPVVQETVVLPGGAVEMIQSPRVPIVSNVLQAPTVGSMPTIGTMSPPLGSMVLGAPMSSPRMVAERMVAPPSMSGGQQPNGSARNSLTHSHGHHHGGHERRKPTQTM